MSYSPELLEAMKEQGVEPLELTSTFTFECQPSCWGTCCSGINILLNPYDVYRMAKGMGKTMAQFIEDHCQIFPGGNSKWPVVMLDKAASGPCEFLEPTGMCGARDHRPSVCRSSPLGRVTSQNKDTGVIQEVPILKLPHPQCQKKNMLPVTREWTVAEFIEDNQVDEWWAGGRDFQELMLWALKDLEYTTWATDRTFSIAASFLYQFDMLVPAGTDEGEMFRRSIQATKHALTSLAAGFGYGPQAGQAGPQKTAAAAIGAVQILKTGTLDEQAVQAEAEAINKQLLRGFLVVDPEQIGPIRQFDSFDLADGKKLLEFLSDAGRKFQPLHRWIVVMDKDAHSVVPADELLKKSKMAQLRRARAGRDNLRRQVNGFDS